jgi:hypothetical protein
VSGGKNSSKFSISGSVQRFSATQPKLATDEDVDIPSNVNVVQKTYADHQKQKRAPPATEEPW